MTLPFKCNQNGLNCLQTKCVKRLKWKCGHIIRIICLPSNWKVSASIPIISRKTYLNLMVDQSVLKSALEFLMFKVNERNTAKKYFTHITISQSLPTWFPPLDVWKGFHIRFFYVLKKKGFKRHIKSGKS